MIAEMEHKETAINGKHYQPAGMFSYYPGPIKNVKPKCEINIVEVFRLIKEDQTLKERTEYVRSKTGQSFKDEKEKLCYVTFGGSFTTRADKNLIAASKYYVADLDHLKNPIEVKGKLINDHEIRPVGILISPSSEGLKVVFKIDPALIDIEAKSNRMRKVFYTLNNYFSLNYADVITPDDKGNFIDPACKDVSRATFLCHDSEAYFNPDETSVIDTAFYDKYYKLPEKIKKQANKTKPSPRTTIGELAIRHLATENHHGNGRDFICACIAFNHSKETVINYIDRNVKFSVESAWSNREKMIHEVNDLYHRYNTNSPETIYLTELAFAYDIFLFKYSKDIGYFILSGLYYLGVLQILHRAGYWKRYDKKNNSVFVKQTGCIIEEVTSEMMKDIVLRYVEKIKEPILFKYHGNTYTVLPDTANETFLKNSHNLFNDTWLEHLQIHTAPVLKDKARVCYFTTPQTLITITADSIDQTPLKEIKDCCVWKDRLMKREFTYTHETKGFHFGKFLRNVTVRDTNKDSEENYISLCSMIGYLLHHYMRLSEGQAVIFYDNAITDTKNPMGGTGKGLIVNGLKQVRDVTKIDGKHFDPKRPFKFEAITNSTQIAWIDDTKPDFDFSLLHSNLTDGWTIEKKYKDQVFLQPEDSPKVVICSNSIIEGSGTTNKRRQFVFELGNHYSKQIKFGHEKPIEQEHGGLFFTDDWPQSEWNAFYSLLCDCVQLYLSIGVVPQKGGNVELNRFRQATNEDFDKWCETQDFETDIKSKYDTKTLFTDFVTAYYGENSTFQQRTFTTWLKKFATFKGWEFCSSKNNHKVEFWFKNKNSP
jgi:hypothetical protein